MMSIEERLRRLGIGAADLVESFTRSSGPGGQHVNKVSTAVTLTHGPSRTSVTAQDSRSQARNRAVALERLLDALERKRDEKQAAQRAAAAKIRRRNSPRPPRLRRRILEEKRNRSQLKKLRARPLD